MLLTQAARPATFTVDAVDEQGRTVPTAIAGIYGMNFQYMPELTWHYGYFMVLALIFGAAGLLFWRFRRSGWI